MLGLDRHKCNHSVETDHENIVLLTIPDENDDDGSFKFACDPNTLFMALSSMKIKKMTKAWITFVHPKSVSLMECSYDDELWKSIWKILCENYDCDKPHTPEKITHIRKELQKNLLKYEEENTMLLCEVPRIHGNVSEIKTTDKFSAYHMPNAGK